MTEVEDVARSVKGHADFSRLWAGLAVSQLGSAVGMVALPVVAVVVLDASAFQVSLLSAMSALTVAMLAFPVGGVVEHRRKRPVLITADLLRFLSVGSVPLAGALGILTFAQLCVVGALNAIGQISFQSASQAQLKALVGRERIVDANGRLESTQWLSLTVGPPIGGVLVGVLGALGTLVIDAVSFLAGAVAIRRLRTPEPEPAGRAQGASRWSELLAGLTFARRHPQLRWVLASWLCFASAVAISSPVYVIFYLTELHFTAWEYGLVLGLPSLGGFFGARLSRRLAARWGILSTLRRLSLLRGPWQFLIPLAVPGWPGLVMCLVGTFGGLLFSGGANSAMASYRALQTPDHLMSRVSTLFSFTTMAGQPVFMIAGGVLATVIGPRLTLVVGATLMAVSASMLLGTREPEPAA